METICKIITFFAAFAFMLSMCTIEGNIAFSVITMLISGAWLAGYGYVCEEKEREREKRGVR